MWVARGVGSTIVGETVSVLLPVACDSALSTAPSPQLLPIASPLPLLGSLHPTASNLLLRASCPSRHSIARRGQVVCVSAKRAASRNPDTHTTVRQVDTPMDSRHRNAAVSPTKFVGDTDAETPAFAWNPCHLPYSSAFRARAEEKCNESTAEYDSAESAVDDLAINFHGATRDTAVGVCGDLIGTNNFPAKTPASCRALDVTFTIFITIHIARRCPWSGTHTPDAGQEGGQVTVAVHAGEESAEGRGGEVTRGMAATPASAARGRRRCSSATAPADAIATHGARDGNNDKTQECRRWPPESSGATARGAATGGNRADRRLT